MTPIENRRAGVGPSSGGDYEGSSNSAKVIPLPTKLNTAAPFSQLTAATVLARFRAGVLDEGVIVALLAGVGLRT
jgi:hypothetical protein